MTERLSKGGQAMYVGCGVLCLIAGSLVALGGMFSSYAFGIAVVLLIDLPIAIGLAGSMLSRKIFPASMIFGCLFTVIYLVQDEYFRIRGGDPPLVFHLVWISLGLILISMAFRKFKQNSVREGSLI